MSCFHPHIIGRWRAVLVPLTVLAVLISVPVTAWAPVATPGATPASADLDLARLERQLAAIPPAELQAALLAAPVPDGLLAGRTGVTVLSWEDAFGQTLEGADGAVVFGTDEQPIANLLIFSDTGAASASLEPVRLEGARIEIDGVTTWALPNGDGWVCLTRVGNVVVTGSANPTNDPAPPRNAGLRDEACTIAAGVIRHVDQVTAVAVPATPSAIRRPWH